MRHLFVCFCLVAFTISCTESDNSTDDNFFALTVGNYWVYKNYKYNRYTETYNDVGVKDSISIVSTQKISGETYYKFRRFTTGNEQNIVLDNENGEHFEFLREFEGNLINEKGAIKFTNNNFEERLLKENDWGNIYETLIDETTTLNVEAGEFSCINSERYAKNPEGERLTGLDRFYYANGFGLIYDTKSVISIDTPIIIRRLYSFEVQ
ncbi:hypothetical protein [Flavicella sediminum]|uniref:hypothetical protein n=1 Tax=Flavicella sediminum TaxID=2585141 RepID=UPI00111EFDC9|nr:hypothetical protein [Flavicella sediminum]